MKLWASTKQYHHSDVGKDEGDGQPDYELDETGHVLLCYSRK